MISGNGDYQADLSKMVKGAVKQGLTSLGSKAGAYIGNTIGLPMTGAKTGARLAARLSKLIGTGDYASSVDVVSNSLIKPAAVSQYASFADSKSSVRLMHREYLQDAFTGSTVGVFNNTSFSINPGLSNTFPFLSQIASNFEEYKFHGLVFEFVSTTSPYNTSSAMGSCIMAMEYNANSPPYTSKPQMENSDFAISARPDKSMIYGVECSDNATNHLFIRGGNTTLPLTSTDIGKFQFATLSPLTANTTLGEIWVTYDVELFRPKVSANKAGYYHLAATIPNGLAAKTLFSGDVVVKRPATVSPVLPVATGNLTDLSFNPSGSTFTLTSVDVGDVIYVSAEFQATTTLTNGLTFTANASLTPLSVFGSASTSYDAGSVEISTSVRCKRDSVYLVNSNAITPTLSLASGQQTTSAGTLDVFIISLGNGLTQSDL